MTNGFSPRGFRPAHIVQAEKSVVDSRAVSRSVIEGMPRSVRGGPSPTLDSSVLMLLGQFAEEIAPFGPMIKMRDQQLRNFILKENIFAAALGIICSRNSGFSWKLDGPTRLVNMYQEVLENANQGAGWHDLIVKTTIDLSTQDNGAFWEFVRAGAGPDSPVIGINNLDAARCWHTGNKETPVIYYDRMGRYHQLNWWEVVEFAEMPSPVETFYGLQYSALSRLLRKAQIMRNDDVLDYEKSSGQNARQIHLVKGVTTQQITDAITLSRTNAQNLGYTRFMMPVLAGTIDPTSDVGHDTIELASKASTDSEVTFVQYINLIAMAFESDYQEFAPLPGQKLGTGAQSETLHLKARGKGPGTFMKLIQHALNFRALPSALRFFWDETDLEAEKSEAEVAAIRAQNRATRIVSGEITPEIARQIAADEGDLKLEYIAVMHERDVTPDVTVDNNSSASGQTDTARVSPGTPGPSAPPGGAGSSAAGPSGRPVRMSQPASVKPLRAPTPMGTKVEDEEPDWFDEYQEKVKSRFDSLLEDLEVARQPRRKHKILHRDKRGLLTAIEEIEEAYSGD